MAPRPPCARSPRQTAHARLPLMACPLYALQTTPVFRCDAQACCTRTTRTRGTSRPTRSSLRRRWALLPHVAHHGRLLSKRRRCHDPKGQPCEADSPKLEKGLLRVASVAVISIQALSTCPHAGPGAPIPSSFPCAISLGLFRPRVRGCYFRVVTLKEGLGESQSI